MCARVEQDIWITKGHAKYMDEELSAYRMFVEEHEAFLKKHRGATERKRKRPNRFLERVGLECALWPHLYWTTKMCESYERASDSRRVARVGRGRGFQIISPQLRERRRTNDDPEAAFQEG